MKLNSSFRQKKTLFKRSLEEVDELYKSIVCVMSYNHRKDYCKSLIYRTAEDLDLCKCKFRSIKLKQLLKATRFELKKLKNHQ